jgi:hypothetical protein
VEIFAHLAGRDHDDYIMSGAAKAGRLAISRALYIIDVTVSYLPTQIGTIETYEQRLLVSSRLSVVRRHGPLLLVAGLFAAEQHGLQVYPVEPVHYTPCQLACSLELFHREGRFHAAENSLQFPTRRSTLGCRSLSSFCRSSQPHDSRQTRQHPATPTTPDSTSSICSRQCRLSSESS